jgi:glycerophosphoryl diester phosphodiesterase
MRTLLSILTAAALLTPGAMAHATESGRPIVIAHRGGALLMPENTLPAFDNAVALGAEMLEFDMVMTADDQLVVQHDPTVNATFCTAEPGSGVSPGPVRAMKLADVLKFDCGSKHRAIYPTQRPVPGARMPTPDAVFARYKDTAALFFGETKMPKAGEGQVDPVTFARLIEAAVRKHGLEDRFILQSFDWRTIDAMHEINPRIRTCLLGAKAEKGAYLPLLRQHHASCLTLSSKVTDAEEVRQLRDAGVMVISDVVDDEAGWRINRELGMSAIFTNDPEGLITFLKRSPN